MLHSTPTPCSRLRLIFFLAGVALATLLAVIGCVYTTDWTRTIESIRMEVAQLRIPVTGVRTHLAYHTSQPQPPSPCHNAAVVPPVADAAAIVRRGSGARSRHAQRHGSRHPQSAGKQRSRGVGASHRPGSSHSRYYACSPHLGRSISLPAPPAASPASCHGIGLRRR